MLVGLLVCLIVIIPAATLATVDDDHVDDIDVVDNVVSFK